MVTSAPLIYEVGISGASGIYAARTAKVEDKALKPSEFFASTLKLYVNPIVNPVTR